MTDVEFLTTAGEPIRSDPDGLEAVHGDEFIGWQVRWNGRDRGAPYVRIGVDVLQLRPTEEGYELPPEGKGKKGKPRNARFAGVVMLFADAECTEPLRPWLRVESANLSPADFSAVLSDLQALAFALSAYLSTSKSPVTHAGGRGAESSLLRLWIDLATAAAKCIDVYRTQLPQVAANPARSMRRKLGVLRTDRAIRSGKAHLAYRWPDHVRFIRAPVLDYAVDTPEARFVAATLQVLCQEASAVASLLRRRLQDLDDLRAEVDDVYSYAPGFRRARRETPTVDSVEEAVNVARQIEAAVATLGARTGSRVRAEDTLIRTNKLMIAPEYQPITTAWEAYRDIVRVRVDDAAVLASLDEQSIANAAALYERWVTVRVYTALVERGFRPPPGERNLLDQLTVSEGSLALLDGENTRLRLGRRCGTTTVELVLRHEPRVYGQPPPEYRKPDLVIEARASMRSELWVFDAKYKNYALSAPSYQAHEAAAFGSHFHADLVGVAERNYRQWIQPAVDLAAIVHPDTRPAYSFWDPLQRGDVRPPQCTAPTPHALLSVCLRPGPQGEANITKLMRLLLGYRLGLVSTCWRCGGDGTQVPVRSKGDGYECERCGSSWIVHFCVNPACRHKPLLKFGQASFHLVEPPPNTFNVHCPRCGSYLPRGDASQVGSSSAQDWTAIPHDDFLDEEPF